MVTTTYDIGDTRRLQATFKDINQELTDPTTVTFTMTEPDGIVTTYVKGTDAELVRNSLGVFHVDWPIAKQGRHAWSLAGTGTVAQKEEDEFYVKRSNA